MKNVESLGESIRAGNSAIESGQYSEAAQSFGAAIDVCQSILVELHCSQARALSSCDRYSDAYSCTQEAIRLNDKHAKAWYLNGTVLFHLGKRPDAKKSFLKAADLEENLTTKLVCEEFASRCDEDKAEPETAALEQGASGEQSTREVSLVKDSTRMQWYQSSKFVTIDIYAKNVIKEESEVSFTDKRLYVCLKRPVLDDYVLEIDLAEEIVPSTSTWTASRVKTELRLCKLRPTTWRSLDRDMGIVSATVEAAQLHERRVESTKKRQEGWDSFAEKELKDYKESDNTMELFQSIYKDADEDTRRAMVKSYSESGGQVLSTNWSEVKNKKVVYEDPKQQK